MNEMRKTLAIARLVLKAAIRSRLFATAAVVLFAAMASLPFLVKGDGTPVGEARVLVYYNIGIASFLIGALALIEACGAVSQEISEKQIQLVRSKPVSTIHIWVGKWLGILAMTALLVTVAGVTTRVAMSVRGMGGGDVDKEVLTARRRLAPAMASFEQDVDDLYNTLKAQGRVPENADEDAVKEQLKPIAVANRITVGAGEERRWTFDVPSDCRPTGAEGGGSVELRSRFNAAMRDEKPMKCSWRVIDSKGAEILAVPAALYYDGMNSVSLPADLVKDHSELTVVFRNEEARNGRTVVFRERRGIEILVTEGGFAMNMFRALLIVFLVAGLLAALGLTLGSLFHLPVAVFVSLAIVLASFTAHFFMTTEIAPHSHGAPTHQEPLGDAIGESIAVVFETVVGPVIDQRPAETLSEGLLVSWRDVGKAALLILLAYVVLLFAAGAFGLSRRQLALPDTV